VKKKKIVLSFDPKSIFFGMTLGLVLGYLISPKENVAVLDSALPQGHPPVNENNSTDMPVMDEQTAQQMNAYREELDSWKSIWEKDNTNWMAALKVADMYYEVQFYDRSIPWYQKALNVNDVPNTRNDMAFAQFMAGVSTPIGATADSESFILASINTLEKLIADHPNYPNGWLTYGFVMTNTGEKDIAFDAFSKCSELDPDGAVGDEARSFLRQYFKDE
tara:strand:- start:2422 stop:3081 length:660 start_codon:yes stop_codon:yes gene_type:complete